MTKKEKLSAIAYMIAELDRLIEYDKLFICHLYRDWASKSLERHWYDMREFPELRDEIIRVGRENNPDYGFPCAITYYDVMGQPMYRGGDFRVNNSGYNREKQRLLRRVEAALN